MLGKDHALLGGIFALSAAPLVAHHLALPALTLPRLAAVTVLTVGAGLLPDWDQPGASPSRTFPLVGMWLSELILKLCGRHRGCRWWFPGTHSLAAAVLFAWGVWVADGYHWGWIVSTFVLVAMAFHFVSRLPTHSLVLAAGATYGIERFLPLGDWAAVAVSLGVCSHLLGDMIATKPGTDGGVPLLWPLPHRFGIRLFRTGGSGEMAASMVMTAVALGLAWLRF